MTDFDKELVSALKDFEDRNITLASYMERVKQAVDKYVIGEGNEQRRWDEKYGGEKRWSPRPDLATRDRLRAEQRQSLWGDRS